MNVLPQSKVLALLSAERLKCGSTRRSMSRTMMPSPVSGKRASVGIARVLEVLRATLRANLGQIGVRKFFKIHRLKYTINEFERPRCLTLSLVFGGLERAMGIEPTAQAWEAWVLPLYDARAGADSNKICASRRIAGASWLPLVKPGLCQSRSDSWPTPGRCGR